jgi:hypothetical protein
MTTRTLAGKTIPVSGGIDAEHILTLSPPLNLNPRWAGAHLAYTLSKYGMSLCTPGLADFGGYRLAAREEDLDLDFFLPDALQPARA